MGRQSEQRAIHAEPSRRAPWVASALALSALSLAEGCGKTDPPRRPQGLLPGEEGARAPVSSPPETTQPLAAPPRPTTSQLPSPFAQRAPDPGALMRADAGATDAPAAEEPSAASASDAGPPPRDLSAELSTMLGAPVPCVDYAAVASGGGRLTIGLSAYVVPSGRITRATVRAPGQPSEAVRCLEKRLSSASFRGPVEGAPREVSATVPLEVVSQPAQPAPAAAPPAEPSTSP